MNAAPAHPAQRAADALTDLAQTRPELAETLAGVLVAVAAEAGRTARFANALEAALTPGSEPRTPKRTGRRAKGPFDPFAVYAESGEAGLREQLARVDLEALRDIVAEHGMDHDRLAMKWRDTGRVIERIVEKVAARTAKGSAFRPEP